MTYTLSTQQEATYASLKDAVTTARADLAAMEKKAIIEVKSEGVLVAKLLESGSLLLKESAVQETFG